MFHTRTHHFAWLHIKKNFFLLALHIIFSFFLIKRNAFEMSDNDKYVLDPSVILHSTSQVVTRLNNPHDAIAAAAHAIMLSVGFRFAGLGDDARQGKILHCSTIKECRNTYILHIEGDGTTKKLPETWNENGPHNYNFRYSHPQSSLTFVIKIVRLGDKCIILGLGIGVSISQHMILLIYQN
jgi:proteasome inhibitor subunit 1 (PI31)